MYKQFPCYYPGEFNPPTKFHLNTVEWLLTRPEIGHVHIVLGNDDPNQLYQDKKAKLWEMLIKSSFSPNVSILRSKEDHPIAEIRNHMEKKKESPFYIALDEETARNKELQKAYESFKHYQMEIIPSNFRKSSKQMLDAVLNKDTKTVKSLLPDTFNDQGVQDYIDTMKNGDDPEAPMERSPFVDYKNQYINKFNDGFWTNAFAPMINEWMNEAHIPDGQVGNYKYKGLTPSVITSIATVIGRDKDLPDRESYIKFIDKTYDELVSKNPELKNIETDIPDYRDVYFPKHDIVFGAISGIPPEDIKTYVEDSKGHGGVYLTSKGIATKNHIQYVSKDTEDIN
jgi:hypothetical protein